MFAAQFLRIVFLENKLNDFIPVLQGILPTFNYQQASFEHAAQLLGNVHAERIWLRNLACMGCSISCGKMGVIRRGRYMGTVADNVEDPDLKAAIQGAVDEANKAVSKAESIRTFRILPTDFTIEGGELTPTLKVKRRVVADHFGSAIESIYTK